MRQRHQMIIYAIALITLLVHNGEAGLAQQRNYRSVEEAISVQENHIPVILIKDEKVNSEPLESERLAEAENPTLTSEPLQPLQPEPVALETETKSDAANKDKLDTDTDTTIQLDKEKTKPTELENNPPSEINDDEAKPNLRQAASTQPTPTQSTTQQNFVQFLQNSPVGQFLSQLTGQNQQQQQQQQAASGQVSADEPATPQPTLPGFLNPGAAITSAQQAVQNAAQTFVNSTQQAFQGIQQFANNLGSQFQSTLTNLGQNNNNQQAADSTTSRPPGPLQGIISFFQGNNRPGQAQTQTATSQAVQPLQPLQNPVNDKIDTTKKKDEPQPEAGAETEPTAENGESSANPDTENQVSGANEEAIADIAPEPNTANNELRNSNEVADDSFEEAVPGDLIVVDDDAAEPSVRAIVPPVDVIAETKATV